MPQYPTVTEDPLKLTLFCQLPWTHTPLASDNQHISHSQSLQSFRANNNQKSTKSNQPGEKEWYLSTLSPVTTNLIRSHQEKKKKETSGVTRDTRKKERNNIRSDATYPLGFFLESLSITLGQQYTHKGHMYKCLQNVAN